MRNISDALKAHLASGNTTICRCWKIQRTDGVILGFSDHDQTLAFEGAVFEAESGLDATALQTAVGLNVDNSEATGALSSDGITSADIGAGKYDDAEVYIWIVNWMDVAQRYMIFRGKLGEITIGARSFSAELRSVSDQLNRPVGRTYLKQCSAQLGDKGCKFALDSENWVREFALRRSKDRSVLYLDPAEDLESDWFSFGTATFLSGENQSVTTVIRSDQIINSERRIELSEKLYFAPQAGDVVRLSVGCDKQAETCGSKFNNIKNFQGFPFVPGEDWSLSFPTSANSISTS
ncbi:hypothetical protein GCM10007939_03440 [Amylibacter marinus]|uniref:Bacteriophage phiJL001 Gp84 C-terminal domain-containing protein n=1 Tax=Amylibacter marinus TaxID=1475483 RepID=A0ABQ5VS01_9RHOB|nr:DUF2163 domain-containing protein [Amylibacter marinus]GLQ34061.1 hypothetical protein GCM10007939_03440 [Amylibacter marinus]